MEINFYCINNDINNFLYKFLLQLVTKEKRVIIYSESKEKICKLDEMFWLLGHSDFLPHGIKKDGYIEHHPLYLTHEKENPNNSEFLLISNFLDDIDYLQKFKKFFTSSLIQI
jgi:DNA polymerase III subunit chi